MKKRKMKRKIGKKVEWLVNGWMKKKEIKEEKVKREKRIYCWKELKEWE